MNKIIYLFALLMGCSSCTKEVIYNVSGKPILFSQEMEVESRAGTSNSVESMYEKSFGVRGYKYEAPWNSEQTTAHPDAKWHNVPVTCDKNGACTYDPIDFWADNMRYAFFGYYPFSTGPTHPLQLSSVTKQGPPVMTYTLSNQAVGTAPQWVGDPSAMYDVMYGSVTDANSVQNTTVGLSFKHALFGVQVVAENFHETTPVTIEELSLTLNLKYRKMDIPMNGDPVTSYFFDGTKDDGKIETDKTTRVTFHIIKKGAPAITVNSTLNLPPKDLSNGQHLLLIPQERMKGEATVKVKGEASSQTLQLEFPNAKYKAGIRYMLDIQFVGEQVNIIIIQGSEWIDNDSIIEFE